MSKFAPFVRSLAILVGGVAYLLASPSCLAQFKIGDRPLDIHGFVTQGFAYSNQNNYLTMPTSRGTFALTDAGLHMSLQVTDKLRIGGQAYTRRIGDMGNGHVYVDWASADYRFKDWLGVRAGKVKTVLGLYNDTQDLEFVHTWALLPQSVYSLDQRGTLLAHLGGDVYGTRHIGRLGSVTYTAYAGRLSGDGHSGIAIGLDALGINLQAMSGKTVGADMRWNTPLSGLLVGLSHSRSLVVEDGALEMFGGVPFRSEVHTPTSVFYAQYTRRNLKMDAEFSRADPSSDLFGVTGPLGTPSANLTLNQRSWYTSVTYRLSRYVEVGTYHSRFYPNDDRQPSLLDPQPSAARHIYDQAATIRLDLKDHWDLKLEGHFMDGYGDSTSFRGFYPQTNPMGLKPKTNLLVIRLGFNI